MGVCLVSLHGWNGRMLLAGFSDSPPFLLVQEYEIDKTLGIKGPEDVAKMGIAEYNKQCRNIVMRYSNEWEVSVCVCLYV